jgi:hypothetical protein
MSKTEKLDRSAIPVLDGWVSLPDAGARLGLTRQRLFQMVDEGKWETLHQIFGKPSDDPDKTNRPALLVVRIEEVNRLQALQRASDAAAAESTALAS